VKLAEEQERIAANCKKGMETKARNKAAKDALAALALK